MGLLFIADMILAQAVGQGAWMVGGSASFSSTKLKDANESSTEFILNPNLGYFIADDLAIGLGLTLDSDSPAIGESTTNFALGPFIRFYFVDAIFAQAGLGLGLGDLEYTDIDLGIGYSWFLNNSVAIEPRLFYKIHGEDGDANDANTFGLSVGIQAFAHHEHGME